MNTVTMRRAALWVALLVFLLSMPTQAVGAFDSAHQTTLTISHQNGGTVIPDAPFALYEVASRQGYAAFTMRESYTDYKAYLQTEDWTALANTLKGFVQRKGFTPDAVGTTDGKGQLTFSGLEPGLYLVVGQYRMIGNYSYDPAPFLVALPGLDRDGSTWQYAVSVTTKNTREYHGHSKPHNPPATPETVTKKVLKIWEDEGLEEQRPKEITIHLLRDGVIYDTVTLTAENNWRYTWEKLEKNHNWLVTEEESKGYVSLVEEEGSTFTVTNYPVKDVPEENPPLSENPPADDPPDDSVIVDIPDDPTPSEETPPPPANHTNPNTPSHARLPQTGLLWWPVPVLLSVGILCVAIGIVRRRGDRDA